MWTEKILRFDEDHPHKPKTLLVGPTGVSASLIGINNPSLSYGICIVFYIFFISKEGQQYKKVFQSNLVPKAMNHSAEKN